MAASTSRRRRHIRQIARELQTGVGTVLRVKAELAA